MKYFQCFHKETYGAIVLIIASAVSLLLANMEVTRDPYFSFLKTSIDLKIGSLEINQSILLWINDALMAVFFLLVGIEVKEALIEGSLASIQQAIFPVIAAIGGMILPALIYLLLNFYDPITRIGWGIPTVTDIAFSLGVLALLGNRVPESLKIFLMALAIVDDLGAILIITLFYTTTDLSVVSLGITVIATVILLVLNLCNIRSLSVYILIGIVLWISVLKSGINTTISGVIISFFLPFKKTKTGKESPARVLKDILHPWVTFLILPLFAFANSGISLENAMNSITSTLTLGIIVGLLIGKPFGIGLFCWIALKLRLAQLPYKTSYNQIISTSTLCGIGFTMSVFIATLAFDSKAPELIVQAKLGILSGSLLSSILGYNLLRLIHVPHKIIPTDP